MNTNALLTALRDARAAFQVLDATIGVLETELAGGPASPPPAAPAAAAKPAATPTAAAETMSHDQLQAFCLAITQKAPADVARHNVPLIKQAIKEVSGAPGLREIPADKVRAVYEKIIASGAKIPDSAKQAA